MKRYIKSNNIRSRIIVCGGRHFDNYTCLCTVIDSILSELNLDFDEIEIVSGNCSGADQLGERYADDNDISYSVFPAQWSVYGRSAGPIRNSEMVKYASESEIPVVVAFVSPNTKGTQDTIKKAQKLGFKLFINDYATIETSVNIFSGIRLDDSGEYEFDFDSDNDGDIVKLTKQNINISKYNGNVRYFGYKVEQDVSNEIKKQFLSWIKTSDGYENLGVLEMIDRCVEDFTENNMMTYDYVIETASLSNLTKIIANHMSVAFDNAPIISTNKLSVENLSINYDKALTELKRAGKSDEYIYKLFDFIQQRYIDPQIKDGYFSMRRVSPKYRKWVSPMFEFSDVNDITTANSVLIVDETFTSGGTANQIIDLLHSVGYVGIIHIFTLLSNR